MRTKDSAIPDISLVPMVSLVKIITPSNRHYPNFLIEGVSCDLDKESARIGHTMVYFLFGHWIERSQMTPYLKKLTAF